jgi:hypothetical protein
VSSRIAQDWKIQAKLRAIACMFLDTRWIDPQHQNIQGLELRRIVPQGR